MKDFNELAHMTVKNGESEHLGRNYRKKLTRQSLDRISSASQGTSLFLLLFCMIVL